jgi:hypothetical protein
LARPITAFCSWITVGPPVGIAPHQGGAPEDSRAKPTTDLRIDLEIGGPGLGRAHHHLPSRP